ncbi:MAG: hypothetical protein MSA49_00225 [Clostridia bacterium]|nr:hypothetical protein [Clostridia bacterium]
MIHSEKYIGYADAMIEITVTTAQGTVPLSGAQVVFSYDGTPDEGASSGYRHEILCLTDAEGRAGPVKLKMRRALIGQRYIDFPRNAGCDVRVVVPGYVKTSVRGIPIFPWITVKRSIDVYPLQPREGKNGVSD